MTAKAKADAAVKNEAIKAQLARQLADRAHQEQQEHQEEMEYAQLEQVGLASWEACRIALVLTGWHKLVASAFGGLHLGSQTGRADHAFGCTSGREGVKQAAAPSRR